MASRTLRRFSWVVLAGLVLLPAAARASPLRDGERRPAVQQAAGGFLAWVGEVVGGLWEATGIIDPNGQPGPSGSAEGDTGMMIDPNG